MFQTHIWQNIPPFLFGEIDRNQDEDDYGWLVLSYTLALTYRTACALAMIQTFCVSNARDMFGRCSTRDSPTAALALSRSLRPRPSPTLSSPSSLSFLRPPRAHLMVVGAEVPTGVVRRRRRTSSSDKCERFENDCAPHVSVRLSARPLNAQIQFFLLCPLRFGWIAFHRASLNFRAMIEHPSVG